MERTLAVLFVDIVDSTRLYETLGNVEASSLTRGRLQELIRTATGAGGRVIKSLGDGLLCAFEAASAAAAAACDMVLDPSDLSVRVGLHYGAVVETSDNDDVDIVGDAVNLTARLQSLARPGEILATEDFVVGLPSVLQARAVLLDRTAVKGKTTQIAIYTLHPLDRVDDSLETTVVGSQVLAPIRDTSITLQLTYRGETHVIGRAVSKLTVGRGDACDLRIWSKQASRQHGSIEFSRETFILTDHSSNGTYLLSEAGYPIHLHRDSAKVIGAGLIGFGAAPEDEAQDHVVRYRSEEG